jgi:hypothetical protein
MTNENLNKLNFLSEINPNDLVYKNENFMIKFYNTQNPKNLKFETIESEYIDKENVTNATQKFLNKFVFSPGADLKDFFIKYIGN